MTTKHLEHELAALRSLARRLSEPWPAEERAARVTAIFQGVQALHRGDGAKTQSEVYASVVQAAPHGRMGADGFWQYRRTSKGGSVWRPVSWQRDARTRRQRANADGLLAERGSCSTRRHSWMPSIARVRPVVLHWPAETVTKEPEAWRTYEAITSEIECSGGTLRTAAWFSSIPREQWIEAEVALSQAQGEAPPWDDFDSLARALADRLAPAAVLLPACARRLDRVILGSLVARYLPAPYNRHDARRWMRRFRQTVLVAGDVIEGGAAGARLLAIEILCQAIGVEDAIGLTERPSARNPDRDLVRFIVDDPHAQAPAATPEQAMRWYTDATWRARVDAAPIEVIREERDRILMQGRDLLRLARHYQATPLILDSDVRLDANGNLVTPSPQPPLH